MEEDKKKKNSIIRYQKKLNVGTPKFFFIIHVISCTINANYMSLMHFKKDSDSPALEHIFIDLPSQYEAYKMAPPLK